MTQDLYDELVDLSWRYAALIGIIDHKAIDITDEEIADDRKRWAHLLKTEDRMPCWDDLEGAGYMAEVSGATPEECRTVLLEEWPIPEEDVEDEAESLQEES